MSTNRIRFIVPASPRLLAPPTQAHPDSSGLARPHRQNHMWSDTEFVQTSGAQISPNRPRKFVVIRRTIAQQELAYSLSKSGKLKRTENGLGDVATRLRKARSWRRSEQLEE